MISFETSCPERYVPSVTFLITPSRSEREEAILFIDFSIESNDEFRLSTSLDSSGSEFLVSSILAEISENPSFVLSTIGSKLSVFAISSTKLLTAKIYSSAGKFS